jgi:lambda family phage minor tail protein L
MAVPVSELQKIAPSSIIELFELQLSTAIQGANTIYRFHAGTNATGANGNVVWAGNAYQAYPIEAEGWEYSGNGQLPRPKIRVSNIMGTITAIILATPLEGAKVTRIRTMARYLDAVNFPGGVNPYGTPDPTAEFPREVYYIDRKSAETRDVVEFELAAAFDLIGVRAPKRQCISNICQWVYRSAECSYTGTDYYDIDDNKIATSTNDACGKRLKSCSIRFTPFKLAGSVTNGSTTMTVAPYFNLNVGQKVSGLGVQANTTISAIVNSTTLTLSSAATMTTQTTKTGTASANGPALVVANTTGISAGQFVTGTYMPAATTIASISGTTLTLNNRPYSVAKTGTYIPTFETYYYEEYEETVLVGQQIDVNTSGISAGMRVFGSNGVDTTVASVSGGTIYLNDYAGLGGDVVGVSLYFLPSSPSSATYTISSNAEYTFRPPDAALPFGSYPGIGTYFT